MAEIVNINLRKGCWTSVLSLILMTILVVGTGCAHTQRGLSHPASVGDLKVHVIDVGYGEAILVHAPLNHYILWDGGYPEKGKLVCEYLKKQGITTLDAVFSTHPHPDHIGGLSEVLKTFKVDKVFGAFPLEHHKMPKEFVSVIKQRKLSYTQVRQAWAWQWTKEVHLKALNPQKLVNDLNDSALVMRIDYHGHAVLLLSDIGMFPQRELFIRLPGEIFADLITLPHHGGALFLPLLLKIKPKTAALSVGTNPYGNPRTATISEVKKHNIQLFRTDIQGNLVFRLTAQGELTCTFSGKPKESPLPVPEKVEN